MTGGERQKLSRLKTELFPPRKVALAAQHAERMAAAREAERQEQLRVQHEQQLLDTEALEAEQLRLEERRMQREARRERKQRERDEADRALSEIPGFGWLLPGFEEGLAAVPVPARTLSQEERWREEQRRSAEKQRYNDEQRRSRFLPGYVDGDALHGKDKWLDLDLGLRGDGTVWLSKYGTKSYRGLALRWHRPHPPAAMAAAASTSAREATVADRGGAAQ